METGPFGYFPKDPARLQEEMDKRGFKVVAGTGWGILHKAEAWADTEKSFRAIGETHAAVGAEYVVHLPPMFRDEKTGDYTDDKVLSTEAWNLYIKNADKLGRIMKEDYGLQMVLHPHGDSHIETPDDIDRVFQATDPDYVGFCLDTGHIVYGGGDPMELCRKYPERISYVHIKAMDAGPGQAGPRRGLALRSGCRQGLLGGAAGRRARHARLHRGARRPRQGALRGLRAGHVPLRPVRPAAQRHPDPRVPRVASASASS